MNGIGSGVRVLADQIALRASHYLGALGPCTLLEGYLSMVHSSSGCWSSDRPLSSLILCASDRGFSFGTSGSREYMQGVKSVWSGSIAVQGRHSGWSRQPAPLPISG